MKFARLFFGTQGLAGALALLFSLISLCSFADEPLLPPQLVIKQTSDRLQKSLQEPENKKDFNKASRLVEEVLNTHVDFDRISALILGKYWKTASPDQQTRFKKEFKTLLVHTYTTAFIEYANWTIRYLPLKMEDNDNKVIVRTEILQVGAQPVAVNYRMVNVNNDWKVYDVLIEGISLVQNYRTSFTDDVAKGGSIDQLIQQLSQRNSMAHKAPISAAQQGVKTAS